MTIARLAKVLSHHAVTSLAIARHEGQWRASAKTAVGLALVVDGPSVVAVIDGVIARLDARTVRS
jgi:hypothetical protein